MDNIKSYRIKKTTLIIAISIIFSLLLFDFLFGQRDQKEGITTFIEVILNQELGEPFRRDAMKKPVKVAGINKGDMKPQKSIIN